MVLAVLASVSPSRAAERVDLELVLLADASGSIDDSEIFFQRQGYAEAITDPDILAAIGLGQDGKIAVTYVEWGDATSQEVVVPWTIIDGEASAAAFAKQLLEVPRLAFGRNAIGAAIAAGLALIEGNDIEGDRKIIDFSGDSANNWGGIPIEVARQAALASDVSINGLAILCRVCATGRPVSYDLEAAFEREIIAGPASFVVTADGEESFASAVRRKLLLEVAGVPDEQTFRLRLAAARGAN
ncbi:DUF1194 domain-containing protein [Pelagibius sp.]|uniref:DUF1194 domain-containing protein n=1 Tax=Pelagibius sp. TaxID=1931238 RepID=UPI00261FE6BC|nr:DUF1194 domain-containing protein [Pelagibius sp.]